MIWFFHILLLKFYTYFQFTIKIEESLFSCTFFNIFQTKNQFTPRTKFKDPYPSALPIPLKHASIRIDVLCIEQNMAIILLWGRCCKR